MSDKTDAKKREWQKRFIDALESEPNVTGAARAAGVNRQYAYEVRGTDPNFAKAWDDAIAKSVDELVASVFQRSKSSDVLAIFLLKSHRPEVYRDKPENPLGNALDGATVKTVVYLPAKESGQPRAASE